MQIANQVVKQYGIRSTSNTVLDLNDNMMRKHKKNNKFGLGVDTKRSDKVKDMNWVLRDIQEFELLRMKRCIKRIE